MKYPKITVVMPVALHEDCKRSVAQLKKVDYPAEKIEVIVVKGNRPCIQRNKAAFAAKGDIIYFLDNDSVVDKGNFKKIAKYYKDTKLASVGGPALGHDTDSTKQKAFCLLLSSFFSSLSMASRFGKRGKVRKTDEKELILCNMSMRKKVFTGVGGLNEILYPNEENELVNRLNKKYDLIYDPDIVIYRSHRDKLLKFARQLWKEGWGRTRHFLLHPNFFNPLFILPGLFVLYLISLPFVPLFFYAYPFYLYLIWVFMGSIDAAIRGKSVKYFFLCIPLFFVFHISYGIGTLTGFFKSLDPKLKIGKVAKVSNLIYMKKIGKKWS